MAWYLLPALLAEALWMALQRPLSSVPFSTLVAADVRVPTLAVEEEALGFLLDAFVADVRFALVQTSLFADLFPAATLWVDSCLLFPQI